jgi:CubicO group peptidase (beta-lactamase class C family)
MENRRRLDLCFALIAMSGVIAASACASDESVPATELVGLWKAKKGFGPEVRGALTVEIKDGEGQAEVAGFSVPVETAGGKVRFELPDELGSFIGRLDTDRQTLTGHWTQPPPAQVYMPMASPVHFKKIGPHRWRGQVIPRESEYTFFLVLNERDDGTVGAFLRNPDRNLGVIRNLDRVVRRGNELEFIGTFFRNEQEEILLRGRYDPDNDRLILFHRPARGGTYDFTRVDDDRFSGFYARGRNPAPWIYKPPSEQDDGWPVSTLEKVGISAGPIKDMIEKEIDPPAENVHTPYVHGLLIARHGKLVLEEYFHGFHRDVPHDTRSASKSLTSLLTGAAIQAGELDGTSIPVYSTIYGEALPDDLDPRKNAMTLEHLLTMTSGFYCDDRDYEAPGNEDIMQNQEEEPNWYRYTLVLPMVTEPGKVAVYCSVNPNLIGNVLIAATGRSLPELTESLIAEPLDIQRYYLGLQPTGEPYMGGGIHWLPRDFMKIGQVILNGGTWKSRRVVSGEWAQRSISPLNDLRGREYGYLWWVMDYPYKDGTVRAFFAGGNGGQVVIGIPDLDLLITFYGGNYSDPVLYRSQDVLVPEYILKAIDVGN